jgi:hypothetical protein
MLDVNENTFLSEALFAWALESYGPKEPIAQLGSPSMARFPVQLIQDKTDTNCNHKDAIPIDRLPDQMSGENLRFCILSQWQTVSKICLALAF